MKFEQITDAVLEKQLKEARDKYENNKEKILGLMLNQPNEPLNSSSRKIMASTQAVQKLNLNNPEVPLIQTGYEDEFGKFSSSLNISKYDQSVEKIIYKYSNQKKLHYYMITKSMGKTQNGKVRMDLIERISYKHITESYGYMYNNDNLDKLEEGDMIKEGYMICSSNAFNEYGQHRDGVNLNCCYMSLAENNNDPVVISESARKKLTSPEIRKVEILINDNDIPLNLYGNNQLFPNVGENVNFYSDTLEEKNTTEYTVDLTNNNYIIDNYKIFPDINEETKNGIICGIRKENKDQALFSQSINRLSSTITSDTTYKITGRVIEINVYSNKRDKSDFSCYDGQLKYYYDEQIRFAREFVEFMNPYINNSNYEKSYELSKMYYKCLDIINGRQYIKDGKIFSNIYVEMYVYTDNILHVGDKIANRYGGKGVVSFIFPDEMMPRIEGSDDHCEIIWNQATCINRANVAQLVEMSLNYISKNIVNRLDNDASLSVDQLLDILFKYFELVCPSFAEDLMNIFIDEEFNYYNDMCCDALTYIEDITSSKGIYLTLKPISEVVTLDTLIAIYKEFPWITTKNSIVPIEGSDGKIRMIKSNKKSIMSAQYVYRLKQYAEEKFSATSLSATNIRNENSKSKASKMYIQAHSSTPIKMGEMESNIYIHLSPEIYVTNLMLYSTSPQGRRNAEVLLTGDPYDIDVTLSDDAKSRSVEKLNATLKTMGLKLIFTKVPIKELNAFSQYIAPQRAFTEYIPPQRAFTPYYSNVEVVYNNEKDSVVYKNAFSEYVPRQNAFSKWEPNKDNK